MGTWWSSLESLLRAQNILILAGASAAVIVAGSSILGFLVHGRISTLRQTVAEQIAAGQAESADLEQTRSVELEDFRRLLEASETRSEGFLNRIEEMDTQMGALVQERDKWRRAANQPPANPIRRPGELLNAQDRAKFVQILKGSPKSRLTLMTLPGNDTSRKLGDQLASMIRAAGWTIEVVETPVESPPPSHTFVVHSQETIPEAAITLSVVLAIMEMASFPPKVKRQSSQFRKLDSTLSKLQGRGA